MAKRPTTRILLEGALCVASALALSYFEIPLGIKFGGFNGKLNFVMVPLIIYAMRTNVGWGFLAGYIYGIIKYFVTYGTDITWVSLIFDYSLAYGMVGLAGLFHKSFKLISLAAFIGCLGRFAVHYFATVTVYARYVPAEFMGIKNPPLSVYSLLYNGTRMLPITIFTVGLFAILVAMPDILKEQ
ncbi:MAG: energy-coupled thiamine transporter ThiT [Oscillospiraceae bacterium]|nr:energy-coupled thiamine transporter ThiT [Oscillospiraceae bacterium]